MCRAAWPCDLSGCKCQAALTSWHNPEAWLAAGVQLAGLALGAGAVHAHLAATCDILFLTPRRLYHQANICQRKGGRERWATEPAMARPLLWQGLLEHGQGCVTAACLADSPVPAPTGVAVSVGHAVILLGPVGLEGPHLAGGTGGPFQRLAACSRHLLSCNTQHPRLLPAWCSCPWSPAPAVPPAPKEVPLGTGGETGQLCRQHRAQVLALGPR